MNNSFLKILAALDVEALEKIVDEKMPKILLEKFSPDHGVTKITVHRNGKVKLSGEDNILKYQVPLNLLVERNTLLKKVDLKFGIVLGLESQIFIQSDWAIQTKTQIKNYKWTSQPKLDLGLFDFPLDTFVINALYDNREKICQKIDARNQQELDFRERLSQMLAQLPNPIAASPTLPIWWKSEAIKTYITGLEMKHQKLHFSIGASTPLLLSIGLPLAKNTTVVKAPEVLEMLGYQSIFHPKIKVGFQTLRAVTLEALGKQKFEFGNQKIEIADVIFSKKNNELQVVAHLTGSFKGRAIVTGKPYFDSSSTTIKLQNLNLEMEGDNFKSKSIVFLLKNKIETEMKKHAQFPLYQFIDPLKKEIAEKEFAPGMILKIDLGELEVSEIQVEQDGFDFEVKVKGQAAFELNAVNHLV